MDSDRYAPHLRFPPYAFLPGTDPHPSRDPAGHSYSKEPEVHAPYVESDLWHTNTPYLLGVDLYNHGFLWEAHEAWESIWHPSKIDPLQANHLQGLIQCAAACLKVPMRQPKGLERLCEIGTGRLEAVARETGGNYMGLELIEFLMSMRTFAASTPQDTRERPTLTLAIDGVEPPTGRIGPRP